ncbi:MAG: hypothetical protein ABEI99_05435 [Halobaculum sp.]
MSSGGGGASGRPWFLDADPATHVSAGTDPSTARVLGVELGEEYRLAYDWLEDEFEPAATEVDISAHGGTLKHRSLLDDDVFESVTRGLQSPETLPDGYFQPPDLLEEFVARKFTVGRREYDRVRAFDDVFDESRAALARLRAQDSTEARQSVLVTMGEKLLVVGAFLFQRYETVSAEAVPTAKLPVFPSPRQPSAVLRVLTAYDQALPPAADATERFTTPSGHLDGVDGARTELALAATGIAYARDSPLDGVWPLDVGQYDVSFAAKSPETG